MIDRGRFRSRMDSGGTLAWSGGAALGPWPTPPIRSRASPLTGAHRPHARWAVEAVLAPAYDPLPTFAWVTSCKHQNRNPLYSVTYSITSSARTSTAGGTSMPSAFAVLRLTTNINLVGNWTGRSPGLAPRKIRST